MDWEDLHTDMQELLSLEREQRLVTRDCRSTRSPHHRHVELELRGFSSGQAFMGYDQT
ncbi:MAG: hypothetical protein JWR21_20 [Herminiimonas sp.]|nr:hypothetical protein [Herminiimonas sp.]